MVSIQKPQGSQVENWAPSDSLFCAMSFRTRAPRLLRYYFLFRSIAIFRYPPISCWTAFFSSHYSSSSSSLLPIELSTCTTVFHVTLRLWIYVPYIRFLNVFGLLLYIFFLRCFVDGSLLFLFFCFTHFFKIFCWNVFQKFPFSQHCCCRLPSGSVSARFSKSL